MANVILKTYQNKAEPNRVDKNEFLTFVGDIEGTFRDEFSLTEMSLNIQSNTIPNFNYVYIDDLKRYYYVVDIINVRRNLWEIVLAIDVLMSYKRGILSISAFVDRNEYESNPDIIDKKRVIEQGFTVEDIALNNSLFVFDNINDDSGIFVLNGFNMRIQYEDIQPSEVSANV